MRFSLGIRWQVALVVALFLGSLAALLFNSFAALGLPRREQQARDRLRGASRRMAEAAEGLLGQDPPGLGPRLHEITEQALTDFEGAEGGFYLIDEDRFTGYAFPTRQLPSPEPPRQQEPPPLEAPFIRTQARESLHREPGAPALVQVREVETSLVAIATEPVGPQRPARLATWVMVRLTGPGQQQEQARRYRVSAGLALGGVLLALVLTLNLGRHLKLERVRREALAEELRRSEHLAALGKLLAGVAHEVRNPLAGIRSTVQLWQRLPDQARTPASMEAVVGAVDRLNALVGRLLYFARTDLDERRPVDLNAVVRETFELLRPQAEAQGVVLQADLEADLPPVPGSTPALHQVVLNLALNALQAMPDGGRLECRTRRAAGGRVELRAQDTGPGIPPEARGHLFEPFFTTRREGTGLGLALCREIVQQHGGTIDVEPQAGPGAVFRVLLPAAPAQGR